MIEKLIDPEHFCGGPEYDALTKRIVEIRRELGELLDVAGKELLDQMSIAYIRQQEALRSSSFTDGFCTAAELALEILKHRSA